MAGKAAQQRVFGDEAKITGGGGVSTQKRQGMWPHASAPRDWREEAGTKGLGRGAGHLISRCEAPLWVPVQEQCWGL